MCQAHSDNRDCRLKQDTYMRPRIATHNHSNSHVISLWLLLEYAFFTLLLCVWMFFRLLCILHLCWRKPWQPDMCLFLVFVSLVLVLVPLCVCCCLVLLCELTPGISTHYITLHIVIVFILVHIIITWHAYREQAWKLVASCSSWRSLAILMHFLTSGHMYLLSSFHLHVCSSTCL